MEAEGSVREAWGQYCLSRLQQKRWFGENLSGQLSAEVCAGAGTHKGCFNPQHSATQLYPTHGRKEQGTEWLLGFGGVST